MIFYKRCQFCLHVTGFDLDNKTIKKDEEYYCENCKSENKLSKWKKATQKDYLTENNVK